MAEIRARWLSFYADRIEPASKEIFSHVEKMIVGTLIVSAGAHVSSSEPAIVLFGNLRHGLVGRGGRVVRGHTPAPEFYRRPVQAGKGQLARRVSDRDDDLLCRPVGTVGSIDPGVLRRVAGRNPAWNGRMCIIWA
ncbi:hypothetical protein [Bradyrhizobium sp. AUGA SZCCT0431]|uniref:hypothetical protein n=1 Tax=Bradyrhizobium sp. AUGA SZCCT0431 TaxID=2807674 RepID=UPI002012884E|nr:hypothetical protein [Bradyrhizobium sp. AUGA SZCCT0431]